MNFAEIIKTWKMAEQKRLAQFEIKKSEECLTLDQLHAYIQDQYTPAQQHHVDQCNYCTRMIGLFQKYSRENIAFGEKIRRRIESLARLKRGWQELVNGFRLRWPSVPVPARIILSGVALAIIFLLIFIRPESQYAPLARIEPDYYHALTLMGEEHFSEAERLFQQGMAFYSDENYPLAIEKLTQVARIQPDHVNGHFYLGVGYLLQKNSNRAIFHLQKVIALNGEFLFEKCYWYLGNAYLLKNDGKKALEMFDKVVALEGDFEWEARGMIEEIIAIK